MADYNNRMGPLDKALMAAPVDNPERNKLREVVRGSPTQLFSKCRRFLTLGAVYAERETFARKRDVIPTYAQWMTSQGISAKDATRASKRARAEWSAINAHPFVGAVYRGEWPASARTKCAVNAWIKRAAQ